MNKEDSFSTEFKALKDSIGLSNYKAAKILKVHQTTIKSWLDGKTSPSTLKASKIIKTLKEHENNILNSRIRETALSSKESNKIIVILSVSEACKILKEHGIAMSEEHIRAGLIAKVYPFGVAFKMREDSSRYVYEIYKPKLMKWIDEISEEV